MSSENQKDRIDFVFKIMGGFGVLLGSILIPYVMHVNSERNSNNQLYATIVSERERADAELRAKMFENLIRSFFGETAGKKPVKERITLLRLLALNFHDSFNLKPLFEEMDSELQGDDRAELRKIAREITEKQETVLSQVKEGMVFEEEIVYREGEINGIMIPYQEDKAYKGHRLGIEVTEVDNKNDYVRLHLIDRPEGIKDAGYNADVNFKLSFYDMPFIDNTKLFNSTRFAVTLKSIGKSNNGDRFVRIKLLFFPETYMSGRDRPYLDEMLAQLRQNN